MTLPVPAIIPVLSDDDAYPAGAAPWSATPKAVALSSGALAAGVVPGTQLPAQTMNYLGRDWGRAIEAVYDVGALNFPGPQQALDLAFQTSVVRASTKVIGAKAIVGGETFARDYLCFTDTQARTFSYSERDEDSQWTDGATWGGSGTIGNVAAGYLAGVPYLVAGFPVSSSFKKLTDIFSGVWSGAGSAALGGSALDTTQTIYSAKTQDRWFTGATSHVAYTDDLATWHSVSLTGTAIPTYAAAGSDGVAYATNTSETWYSQNTLTWARLTGTPVIISMAYSESHQEWIALSNAGVIYTAPNGLPSWTNVAGPFGAAGPVAVRAWGRCYVVTIGKGVFVASSAAGPWVCVLRPRNQFVDSTICGGRLVAVDYDSSGSGTHYIHRSLRMPFAVF